MTKRHQQAGQVEHEGAPKPDALLKGRQGCGQRELLRRYLQAAAAQLEMRTGWGGRADELYSMTGSTAEPQEGWLSEEVGGGRARQVHSTLPPQRAGQR